MKVRDLIDRLESEYDADDEVVFSIWDEHHTDGEFCDLIASNLLSRNTADLTGQEHREILQKLSPPPDHIPGKPWFITRQGVLAAILEVVIMRPMKVNSEEIHDGSQDKP